MRCEGVALGLGASEYAAAVCLLPPQLLSAKLAREEEDEADIARAAETGVWEGHASDARGALPAKDAALGAVVADASERGVVQVGGVARREVESHFRG